MKIDREQFLLLAAALTAGACGASDAQPAQQATIPPQPAASGEPLAIPPMPSVSAAPSASAPEPPANTPVAHAASPNPYDGTPVTGQSCDPAQNKIGTPPTCKIFGPGPTCESIKDTMTECPRMTKLLKPRVAQAAIECMNRKSGSQDICEFNESSICAYEALASVCLEPSAKATCQGIVQKCGGPKGNYNKMSQESCEAGVSAIADAKKKKFIACISESCRFETCLTYL